MGHFLCRNAYRWCSGRQLCHRATGRSADLANAEQGFETGPNSLALHPLSSYLRVVREIPAGAISHRASVDSFAARELTGCPRRLDRLRRDLGSFHSVTLGRASLRELRFGDFYRRGDQGTRVAEAFRRASIDSFAPAHLIRYPHGLDRLCRDLGSFHSVTLGRANFP